METTKKLFRNLKALLASILSLAAKKSYNPVRELELVKQEAEQKLIGLAKQAKDVIERRNNAKDMQITQQQLSDNFKYQASQAKKENDETRAKKLLEIHLKHKQNIEVFTRSIENLESLRLEIKEAYENLELEVMSIDAQISSVSVMSDLAKLDIDSNDTNSKVNVAGVREAIKRADKSVRNLENKASAQREANGMFKKETIESDNHSAEVDKLYSELV